MMVEVVFFSVW